MERQFNSARYLPLLPRIPQQDNYSRFDDTCVEKDSLWRAGNWVLPENPAVEGEGQETVETDEAVKATEGDIAPISDAEENDPIEGSESGLAVERASGVESIASEEPQAHDQVQYAEMAEELPEDEDDDGDMLPPPFTSLGDRSQKISSGRVTVPSGRLQGYELY